MTTTVVNLYKEPYEMYIGRPSAWGNPWSHREGTLAQYKTEDRETAIRMFKEHAELKLLLEPDWLEPLRGKTLGCFCKPQACHGDVIVELLGK